MAFLRTFFLAVVSLYGLQGSAWFNANADSIILLEAEQTEYSSPVRQNTANNDGHIASEEQAEDLSFVSVEEKTFEGGWFSKSCRKVMAWWKGASWKKRIVWITVGSAAGVSLGVVWLNGGYYLVFKAIKDYYLYFGDASAPGEVVSSGAGLVLSPTSSEAVATLMANTLGATASAVLTPTPTQRLPLVASASAALTPTSTQSSPLVLTSTPTQRPPLAAGACDLVEDSVEKYSEVAGCPGRGFYNGSCAHVYGCAYNGDYLYGISGEEVCRCERACNAPPKDFPCYGYNDYTRELESCEHLPLCDRCIPHWCKVCNGWIPEAENISDPTPSTSDVRAWLNYYGLRAWIRGDTCLPGSA